MSQTIRIRVRVDHDAVLERFERYARRITELTGQLRDKENQWLQVSQGNNDLAGQLDEEQKKVRILNLRILALTAEIEKQRAETAAVRNRLQRLAAESVAVIRENARLQTLVAAYADAMRRP